MNKKKLIIVCDYEDLLKKSIDLYNNAFKTDFEFKELIMDEVNIAVIEHSNESETHIFDLGYAYGRMAEAFDNRSKLPPKTSFK